MELNLYFLCYDLICEDLIQNIYFKKKNCITTLRHRGFSSQTSVMFAQRDFRLFSVAHCTFWHFSHIHWFQVQTKTRQHPLHKLLPPEPGDFNSKIFPLYPSYFVSCNVCTSIFSKWDSLKSPNCTNLIAIWWKPSVHEVQMTLDHKNQHS